MDRKLFWFVFSLILVFQFIVRIIPPQDYNFYFTVDQGNNSVHVREIIEKGKLLLRGPETGISGVYAGPLWYYFLAPAYFISGGDPFGGLVVIILLNMATTALVMWWVGKKVSLVAGLIVGASLQLFWHFYDFSRYEFNPFPMIFLSVWQILLLTSFLQGRVKSYYWALLPVALTFNTEVAGAVAMFLFHLAVGIYGWWKKLLSIRQFVLVNIVLPGIFLIPIALGLGRQLLNSSLVKQEIASGRGIFAGTNFPFIAERFLEIFQRSVIPQSFLASALVVILLGYWFFKTAKNQFVCSFVFLTLGMWAISFLFFASNKGWQDWHTIYLYLFTFISVILMILSLPKRVASFVLVTVLMFQSLLFVERYREYLKPSEDPGILANQLKVIRWLYQNSENDGFSVFTYSPTGYDYNYQYVFWWYGRKVYNFIPCEYSNAAPGVLKLYMPDYLGYNMPTLDCNKFRFLIWEEGKISEKQQKWAESARDKMVFLESAQIGKVKIEKYRHKRREEL